MRFPSRQQTLVTIVALACTTQIILAVVAQLDQNRLDDDAYMFVRYARNAVHHGTISWNPNEAPAYGLTSLGHFAIVLILETALRVDAAWVLLLATLLCGVAFIVIALAMAQLTVAPTSSTPRSVVRLVILLELAWGSSGLASHFVNGMDAAFALVMLGLYFIVSSLWFRDPSRARALGVGALGGFLLWVRPDILLFAFLPPLTVMLWPPNPQHRASALQVLATTTLTASLLGLVAWGYFGSPIPLPTWSKVFRGYGPDMQEIYAHFPAEQLLLFARDHAAPLAVATFGMSLLLIRRGIAAVSFELGVWLATLVFIVFHRFFVLAIMGSHQRFYYPALPAILYLSVQVVDCVAQIPQLQRWRQRLPASNGLAWGVGGLLLAGALASLVPQMQASIAAIRGNSWLQNFEILDNYRNNWPSEYWIRLDGFSQLPDDLVIATTEVGYPGVLNPEKTIVDLAGLNDTHFAKHGFDASNLFHRYQPDLFLLPRSHYAGLRRDLTQAREFRSGYEMFRPARGLTLALRRDSPHYRAMRRVLGLP